LQEFGIEPLTGEACGLMYRILFDLGERGANIVRKCFGFPAKAALGEPWNRGSAERPHVASAMLSQEALIPIGIFALLESGYREVFLVGTVLVAVEPDDPPDTLATMQRIHKVEHSRRFSYGGTAGDRNKHMMSGRIE
jgi:hypothetical protein